MSVSQFEICSTDQRLSVEVIRFFNFEVPSEGLSPVIIHGFILNIHLIIQVEPQQP